MVADSAAAAPALDGTAVPVPQEPSEAFSDSEQPGRFHTWKILSAEADRPTHHHAWLNSCLDHFAGTCRRTFLTVGGEKPTAVAPLIMRGDASHRLEIPGVNELYEPAEFPHANQQSLNALTESIARSALPLVLKRVHADSPLIGALRSAYRHRGFMVVRPVAGYPWISLDDGWRDPESMLSPARRSSLRRARRNAAQIGEIEIEINQVNDASLARALEEAFQIEASGWKGRSGTALASDECRRAFYEQYAIEAHRAGILRLCFLRIAGRAVAMQIAVECGGRFWLLKMGYDESYSKCSPGNLLMIETIRHAASRGLKSYEFLGIADAWTAMWTDQVRPCVSVLTYPRSLRGAWALATDVTSYGRRRIFALLRNFLA